MDKKNHMKCLLITETYLPLFGGAEMYTYNLAKQLVVHGYDVTIMTQTKGDIPVDYQITGVTIHILTKFSKREWKKLPALVKEIYSAINAHELIYGNYTYALSTIASVLARISRKEITIFAHGLGTIIDRTHPKIYHLYRWVSLRLATHTITTSEELASIVRRFTSKVLVATAVDFTHIDYCLAKDQKAGSYKARDTKVVLTIRRLVEKNGIQFLIEAIPYLLKLRQDFVYIVIGDGRYRSLLEERVQELNIKTYVQFLGEVQNEKVFSYVNSADVVVFPSSAEALSLAAIECMHLKTPVVVSAIGGLRELVGLQDERGTSVDLFGRTESIYTAPHPESITPETYRKFAIALHAALSGTDGIHAKAEAAEEYVRNRYDWPLVAERILSFTRDDKASVV